MYSVSRCLVSMLLVAFALAAQPASARQHAGESHHGVYRHHDRYRAAVYRFRVARAAYGAQAYGPQSYEAQAYAPQAYETQPYGPQSYESSYAGGVADMASANGVPASLVERVIKRESGGNPRAVSAGNYGLMQIRLGTARAMGYGGSAAGLLDAATNMTYAVRYLAGAYRAAGGNEDRAVALYARGYNAAPVQASWNAPPTRTMYDVYQAPYGLPDVGYRVVHHRRR